MNPLVLLIRLSLSAKSFKDTISQEAEEFDQQHDIKSPGAKKMAWLLVAGKAVLVCSIMGDGFPLDLLPGIVTLAGKLGWLGVLIVLAAASAIVLVLISQNEKEEQRQKIQGEELQQVRRQDPFLPDR